MYGLTVDIPIILTLREDGPLLCYCNLDFWSWRVVVMLCEMLSTSTGIVCKELHL